MTVDSTLAADTVLAAVLALAADSTDTGPSSVPGPIDPRKNPYAPVSYTHLDVYKRQLYTFSNPVVINAALNILGLPGGHLRKPYQDYAGTKLKDLENLMGEMGVIDKYGVKN